MAPDIELDMNSYATMDYILLKHCGGMGRWQVQNSIFVLLIYYASLYPLFITVFTTYAPDHRCHVENCDTTNDTVLTDWLIFAIPKEESSSVFLAERRTYDSCSKFKTTGSDCSRESFDNETLEQCDAYIFDTFYFEETLATKFGLVCDEEFKAQLLNSVLMIGLLIGGIVGGRLGDKFGRKTSMFFAGLLIIPVTIASGFSPSYGAYAFLRWITCVFMPIVWVNNTVYMLETFTPKGRMVVSFSQNIPLYYFVFAIIVYFSKNWTIMHIGTGVACCTMIPVWFFMPESPRWLIQNNRYEDAVEIVLKIARTNRQEELSMIDADEIRAVLLSIEGQTSQKEHKLSLLDLFRSGHTSKYLILCFAWTTACISYYALTLNSTQLSGNIIFNFALNGVIELPVPFFMLITLNWVGRRPLMVFGHLLLALSCLILAFVPKGRTSVILAFYLIGKAGAALAFAMCYLVTSECFPTNLRTQAVGVCSTISRLGCLLAPFLAPLAKIWQPLPLIVLGFPTLISAFLNLKLPETYQSNLPETMEEAKNVEDFTLKNIEIEDKSIIVNDEDIVTKL